MKREKIGFWGAGKMAEGILSAIPDKRSVVMAEPDQRLQKPMALDRQG